MRAQMSVQVQTCPAELKTAFLLLNTFQQYCRLTTYTFFYKNNYIRARGSFCSKFKNKLRTISLGRRTKFQIFS